MAKTIKQTKISKSLSKDWILLCKGGNKQEKDIYLSKEDRLHHQYFVWQDDTWKSTMILNQVIEDINAWNGFCFIDQYWDYVDEILKYFPKEKIDDLIYIDFSNQEYPIWINILNETKNMDEMDIITNHIIDMFLDMYGPELFGPRIQDYIRNACVVLMEKNMSSWYGKYTFFDIIKLITAESSAFVLWDIKDPAAFYWWNRTLKSMGEREKSEIIPFIQAKLSPLFTWPYVRNILLQPTSSIDFDEAIKENKIIICNLAKWIIWNLNAEMLWRILMMEINMVLSRRAKMKKSGINPYFLYLDGFQDYIWSSYWTFLLNATRYKLWVIMFNQYVAQLQKIWREWLLDVSKFIFNVVGTIWSFRIWTLDAEILEKVFSPEFTKLDLQKLKNNALIIKKRESNSYIKPFMWYIEQHNEKIKNTQKKINLIKEISYLKWWSKREIVDKEIYFRVGV